MLNYTEKENELLNLFGKENMQILRAKELAQPIPYPAHPNPQNSLQTASPIRIAPPSHDTLNGNPRASL
jgi:hypothetical protein